MNIQFRRNGLYAEAVEFDHLVAGGVAAHQFHPTARAIQSFGQKPQQGFICRRVNGRRGDLDAKLMAARFANLVARRARMQFDRQQNAIGYGA
jgi:hypothetical protein